MGGIEPGRRWPQHYGVVNAATLRRGERLVILDGTICEAKEGRDARSQQDQSPYLLDRDRWRSSSSDGGGLPWPPLDPRTDTPAL
jgi:hypothetical protein